MGSTSDLPILSKAADILETLGVPHEVSVVSAHRTPERMVAYAKQAKNRGLKVIIAGAEAQRIFQEWLLLSLLFP